VQAEFGRRLTIGVEEELFLLDPDTLAPAPAVERLLGPDGLKTELFACLVETNTPVCESVEEAATELRRLRGVVHAAAAREGLVVAASGTHPFAVPEEQEILPEPRYLKMLEEVGPAVRHQLVCGLHVHIGMKSFDECLRSLAAVVPWLPALLALSANSPYLAGEESPELSSRADILLELPRAGPPPTMATPADWEAEIALTGTDYTRSWWDARPHPRLGTLEIRIADQPTCLDRVVALVALVQAFCASVPAAEPLGHEAYLERRAVAARGVAPTRELLALVEPAARELGTWALVQRLTGPPEALRQLELGQSEGLHAATADLVERTAA
jgi:carboxylate-amine ligase